MDWLEKRIDHLTHDRRHGAAQLAGTAVRILMAVCRHSTSADATDLAGTIRRTALALAHTRASMAPIRTWSLVFAHRFVTEVGARSSLRDAKRHGVLLGTELLASQHEIARRQAEAARPMLRRCRSLFTLSHSSTVESILRHGVSPGCRVVIGESRPLMEGRRLFDNLSNDITDLRMTTDAQMGLVIPDVDLVLVGADAVLRDLSVVNKAGTYLAALAAQAHGCDFWVATDTYKINVAMSAGNCVLESKSGGEVWSRRPAHSDNVYFDLTPARLISGWVTEEGMLDAAGMTKHVRRRQRVEKAVSL